MTSSCQLWQLRCELEFNISQDPFRFRTTKGSNFISEFHVLGRCFSTGSKFFNYVWARQLCHCDEDPPQDHLIFYAFFWLPIGLKRSGDHSFGGQHNLYFSRISICHQICEFSLLKSFLILCVLEMLLWFSFSKTMFITVGTPSQTRKGGLEEAMLQSQTWPHCRKMCVGSSLGLDLYLYGNLTLWYWDLCIWST